MFKKNSNGIAVVPRLWNDANNPDNYGDSYSLHLFEQYKLCIEMANSISERRDKANSFFLTLNTGVIGLIGIFNKGISQNINIEEITILLVLFLLLCYIWFRLIISYSQLNSAKWKVIGEFERKLPTSPFYKAEWSALGFGKNRKLYWPITDLECFVPIIFFAFYLIIGSFFLFPYSSQIVNNLKRILEESMDLNAFLTSFFATTIGVLLAFSLDRWVQKSTDAKKREKEQDTLQRTLELLLKTIEHNLGQMMSLNETLQRNLIKIVLKIDLLTWEALKSDLIQYLDNPTLKRNIAHHFMDLSYLIKLYDLYFTYQLEIRTHPESVDEEFSKIMLTVTNDENLKSWLPELLNDAKKLKVDIQEELSKIELHK